MVCSSSHFSGSCHWHYPCCILLLPSLLHTDSISGIFPSNSKKQKLCRIFSENWWSLSLLGHSLDGSIVTDRPLSQYSIVLNSTFVHWIQAVIWDSNSDELKIRRWINNLFKRIVLSHIWRASPARASTDMSNLLPITLLILLPLINAQEVCQISHSANMILKSKSKPTRHRFKVDLIA